MSWFDGIQSGARGVMDWFGGGNRGGNNAGAAGGGGGQPAAPAAGNDAGWANSGWAKATGLSPWAGVLGVGQGSNQQPAQQSPGGGKMTSNSVEFDSDEAGAKGFRRDGAGFKAPSYQKWDVSGKSYGNLDSQADAAAKGQKTKMSAPGVWQPDLSKIPRTTTGVQGLKDYKTGEISDQAKTQSGMFRESAYGSYSGGTGLFATDPKTGAWKPDNKFKMGADGKGSFDVGGWQGQWGFEEKAGWRATAISDNKQHAASFEAGAVANAGASGQIGLNSKDGLYANGGVGGKLGWYAQGDADTKTGDVTIGGEAFNAGVGVHGDAFVGAKAGASGALGLGPDFVGAKGEIGAFAGAEAAGDIHGNLGPLGGKVGGSVMAGAGIGADGELSYKDGKLRVGGKMFAALGYGGSLGGEVTVDVGAMGRSAVGLGKTALDYGGKAVDTIGDYGGKAINAIGDAGSTALDYGGKAVNAIGNTATSAANTAMDYGGKAVNAVGNAGSRALNAGGRAVSAVLSW